MKKNMFTQEFEGNEFNGASVVVNKKSMNNLKFSKTSRTLVLITGGLLEGDDIQEIKYNEASLLQTFTNIMNRKKRN